MPDFSIQNFKAGLDTRRSELTSVAGALLAAENGHINSGGVFEKRKAFVPSGLPSAVYGLDGNDSGLYVFGSREVQWTIESISVTANVVLCIIYAGPSGVLPQTGESVTISGTANFNGTFVLTAGGTFLTWNVTGSAPTETTGTAALVLPSTVVFQQLLHPDGTTQMTGVVGSVMFGSFPWVIASFADGSVLEFYNGVFVDDFYAGLIWSGSPNIFTVENVLANIINGTTQVNGQPQKNYPYVAGVTPLPFSLTFSISGGIAYVPAVAATSVFNMPTVPTNGQQVVLGTASGSVTYTFVSGSVGSGSSTAINVKIGTGTGGQPLTNSLTNLFHAINYSGGTVGTDYSTGGMANASALASGLNTLGSGTYPYGFIATAVTAGAAGNSIACTTNVTSASWTPASTLGGGSNSVPAQGQILSVWYNFPVVVQLTSYLGTNSAMIVQTPVAFATDATTLAGLVATAITNATDSYLGGPGDNLGFTATNNGAEVLIIPPVAITPYDSLLVLTDQYLTATVQPIVNSLTITSVPNTSTSSPFAMTTELDSVGGSEVTTLLNVGSPIVPATFAVGSFQISACNISTQASAVLSNNGTNVGSGDTITIGGTSYTFVTTLKGAALNSVMLGSNAQASMGNLISAISAATTSGRGSGKVWTAGTEPNPNVTAGALVTGTGGLAGTYYFTVTAVLGGNIGKSITVSLSSASLSWLQTVGGSAATYLGQSYGATSIDTNQVSQITVGSTTTLSAEVPATSNSPTTLANDVCTAINNNTTNSGFSASCVGTIISIASTTGGTAGNGLNISIACSGAVCVDQAEFLVTGTGNISVIAVAGGPSNLLSATMTFQDGSHPTETLIQFCSRVVANINAYMLTTGYVAAYLPGSSVIYISRATASGADAASVNLTITSTLTCSATTVSMQATASPTVVVIPSLGRESNPVSATVVGGSAPYKYQWTFVSSTLGSSGGVTAGTPTKSSTTFSLNLTGATAGKSFTEIWLCVVTDSSGTPVTVNSSQVLVSYTKQ